MAGVIEPRGESARGIDGGEPGREAAVHAAEAELSELVSRIRLFVRRVAESVSPGLTPANYKVLSMIARRDPITLSALTEHFGVDKALISRAVRELEGLGFVTRRKDPNDGRSQLLSPSELAKERLREAHLRDENRLASVLSQWDVGDIERLASLVHALNAGTTPSSD